MFQDIDNESNTRKEKLKLFDTPINPEISSADFPLVHGNDDDRDARIAAADIPELLLQQQSMLSRDRDQELKTQLAIANELSELTSLLRESTQAMSDAVARQNIVRATTVTALVKYFVGFDGASIAC